jgi:hypothetical protein
MASYAVLWHVETDADPVHLGRVEFDSSGLGLFGYSGAHLYVADADIEHVERNGQARLGRCKALRLRTRDGLSLLVASLSGVGVLQEMHEEIAQRLLGIVV